jgi:hypothetical protein
MSSIKNLAPRMADATEANKSNRQNDPIAQQIKEFKHITIDTLVKDGELKRFARFAKKPGKASSVKPPLKLKNANFQKVSGKPVALTHGSVVEGSTSHGGIQPNYVIDLAHPAFKKILAQVRALQYRPIEFWDKVETVMNIVAKTLKDKEYQSTPYIRMLSKSRKEGKNVSLGDYLFHHCGVCREHALLTHMVLQQAGIKTKYTYVKASQGEDTEDHAIVTIHHGGEVWVLDAYNDNFNGGRFKDFVKPGGSRPSDPRLPFAQPYIYGCSFKVNPYPTYWIPNKT